MNTLTRGVRRITARRLTKPSTPTPPPMYALRFAARQMVHNLVVTNDGTVMAGYRIGGARWSFESTDQKQATLDANADVYAALLGRTIHERVTTRPFPAYEWARRLDQRTPNPLRDVHVCDTTAWTPQQLSAGACGCRTWNRVLTAQQDRIVQAGMDDKTVFRYIRVGRVTPGTDVRGRLTSGTVDGDVAAVVREERRVRDLVATYPWRARPMTEAEQEWLRHRSTALGCPAPGLPPVNANGWAEQDMALLTSDVRWYETRDDRTVRVVAFRGARRVERHVTVLTLGRVEDMTYPQNGLTPWMVHAERAVDSTGAAFPTEWSTAGYLARGDQMERIAALDLAKALNQREAYAEHGEPIPPATGRIMDQAVTVHDDVTTGRDVAAGRFLGVVHAAVWGEDVTDADGNVVRDAHDVCADRAEALQRLYRGNDTRMELAVLPVQIAKVREFVPAEPPNPNGYQHQWALPYLSAGLPNVSAQIGDGHGPYLGYTCGAARRPFLHDTAYATEGRAALGRSQNLWLYVGTLGSGKSVAMGKGAYLAARRGILTVVYDPSGPLGRLTTMPELAPTSFHMDMLDSEPGTLSPPPLVRDPERAEFETPGRGDDDVESRYRRALMLAASERRNLTRDVVRKALEADLYHHKGTMPTLRKAAAMVEWTRRASLWDLVDALDVLRHEGNDHAGDLAAAMRDMAATPRMELMFPARGDAGDFTDAGATVLSGGRRFVVISTPGLKGPDDGIDRVDWTTDQLAAVPLKHLAAVFAGSLLYGKPMSERAVGMFDEADNFASSGAGRAFMTRLGRDHSKWNMEVGIASQDMGGVMARGLRNFIAGVYAGRMASRGEAEAVLTELLDVQDRRYAGTLLRLSEQYPGEFIHSDLDGRVEPVRFDVDDIPGLRDYLLTDPTRIGADGWAHDEVLA